MPDDIDIPSFFAAYGHGCEGTRCQTCLAYKLWPPRYGLNLPNVLANDHEARVRFFVTNADIFGRELWLACRLQADAEALFKALDVHILLGIKVAEVSALARQLAEAQGQWGRELWLCAWMLASQRYAFQRGKEFAVGEFDSVGVRTPRVIREMVLDEQFGVTWCLFP